MFADQNTWFWCGTCRVQASLPPGPVSKGNRFTRVPREQQHPGRSAMSNGKATTFAEEFKPVEERCGRTCPVLSVFAWSQLVLTQFLCAQRSVPLPVSCCRCRREASDVKNGGGNWGGVGGPVNGCQQVGVAQGRAASHGGACHETGDGRGDG